MRGELRGLLDAQHHRLRAHALLGTLPVWGKYGFPFHLAIAQEAVGCAGLAPAIARLRDAGRRIGRKSFHHSLRPLVEAGIAKIQSCKFLFCPLLCYLGHAPAEIPRVNPNSEKFTTPRCNPLNENGFIGLC